MHREILRKKLLAYRPHPEEQIFKEIMLDFLSTSPAVFKRSHCCGHFTASCLLLNKERTHTLLMHHKKLDRWLQLGGHCDGNPDTLAVAIKQAQEESGINGIEAVSSELFDIDIHWIPSNSRENGHYHYDVRYLLAVTSHEQIQPNSESKALRWTALNIKNISENKSISRMFDKMKVKSVSVQP